MSRGIYCNGADFTEISKIPRNAGGTEHAQTVCTRLFSSRPHMNLETRLVYHLPRLRHCKKQWRQKTFEIGGDKTI